MQKDWTHSNSVFLDYAGMRFGQSARASLTVGELVVVEVDKTLMPKFETEEDKKEHLKGLMCWEEMLHN